MKEVCDTCFLVKFFLSISAVMMLMAIFYMQVPDFSSLTLGLIIIVALALTLLSVGVALMKCQQISHQFKL